MEGPILVPAAWLLAVGCAWAYRRFEALAPRDPAFEAWAKTGPVILRARCRPGAAPRVVSSARRVLGGRGVVATLGRPPTPFYDLRVEVVTDGESMKLVLRRATILRAQQNPRPMLTLLDDAMNEHQGIVLDVWLEERLFQDTAGDVTAPHGWRAEVGSRRWRLAPASAPPG